MKMQNIGTTLGALGNTWREQLARAFLRKGLSAMVLTVAGVCFSILGGALIGLGGFVQTTVNWPHLAAGVVITLAACCDLLDDMIARLSNTVTKFGAFSDSLVDYYADIAIFAGTLTYFTAKQAFLLVIIAALAFVGISTTSYARARAESLLPGRYDAGYMQRPEWIAVVILACLCNRLYIGMMLIAVFANLAAFHRIWDTHQTAFNMEHPDQARRGYGSVSAPALARFGRHVIFWTYPRQSWQHDTLSGLLALILLLSAVVLPAR